MINPTFFFLFFWKIDWNLWEFLLVSDELLYHYYGVDNNSNFKVCVRWALCILSSSMIIYYTRHGVIYSKSIVIFWIYFVLWRIAWRLNNFIVYVRSHELRLRFRNLWFGNEEIMDNQALKKTVLNKVYMSASSVHAFCFCHKVWDRK